MTVRVKQLTRQGQSLQELGTVRPWYSSLSMLLRNCVLLASPYAGGMCVDRALRESHVDLCYSKDLSLRRLGKRTIPKPPVSTLVYLAKSIARGGGVPLDARGGCHPHWGGGTIQACQKKMLAMSTAPTSSSCQYCRCP